LFYSITPKRIGIFDRRNREKVIVKRIHDYLFCEKDKHIECDHCTFCLNDKDVKNSLHPKYYRYLVAALRPTIRWPKLEGQKMDFEKIIGDKSVLGDRSALDDSVTDWSDLLKKDYMILGDSFHLES